MAHLEVNCNVIQGFNFEKDSQGRIGHLVSLKIGDTQYKADLKVQDPTKIGDDEGKVDVVGVISSIYWPGGHADPIYFNCRVTSQNKQISFVLQHNTMSKTDVEYSFIIYEYDPVNKVYFKHFHSGQADLQGLVAKDGSNLNFNIGNEESMDVVSPKNFDLGVGVMPKEEEQKIEVGVSNTAKFVKKWGVTVAA